MPYSRPWMTKRCRCSSAQPGCLARRKASRSAAGIARLRAWASRSSRCRCRSRPTARSSPTPPGRAGPQPPRPGEVVALDIDDLDLPRRRAVVIGKGGRAELIGWETRTARLLPRHLAGREQGPLFLTDLAPAPARQPAAADLDPASGHARLSYRRAAQLFRDATGEWTLHQLRHSRVIHLAEAGVQLPILMAKSRHTSLISLAVCAQPTFDAVAAATAALDPDRRH